MPPCLGSYIADREQPASGPSMIQQQDLVAASKALQVDSSERQHDCATFVMMRLAKDKT